MIVFTFDTDRIVHTIFRLTLMNGMDRDKRGLLILQLFVSFHLWNLGTFLYLTFNNTKYLNFAQLKVI